MRKTMRRGTFGLICVLLIAAFLFGMSRVGEESAKLSDSEAKERTKLAALNEQTTDLQSKLANVGTDNYIENEARVRYGFLKAGELRYEFTNPSALYELTDEEYAIWKRETQD